MNGITTFENLEFGAIRTQIINNEPQRKCRTLYRLGSRRGSPVHQKDRKLPETVIPSRNDAYSVGHDRRPRRPHKEP